MQRSLECEKRPRQYAAEIVLLKSTTERRNALELVPAMLRPLVKKHVEIAFDKRPARA